MTLGVAIPPAPVKLFPEEKSVSNSSPLCDHCGFPLRKQGRTLGDRHFCCYGCAFAFQVVSGGQEGNNVSWITVKLGIAAFLAMNVMGFALALHSSSIYPDFYENISHGGRTYDQLLRYFLLFMSAPVFFLIGTPLYENIILEAKAGRWGVDGFIGISVLAAFAYSLLNTLRGAGPVYFDVAVMVLVFLTLGRYLEARFRFKAAQSLENLLEDAPETAHLWSESGEREVPAETLQPGDILLLKAGSRVPADGMIEEGSAVLEMAAMTGEFLPAVLTAGDGLWAGAFLTEGFVRMRVSHRREESWSARLKETLQQARGSKAPIEHFSDRAVFAVTCFTAVSAAAAFYLGAREHGLMAGLLRMLAVLVIVCPCALGAAIPLALWKTFETVVSRGILFKDLSRLEMLSKIKAVFFDKTGTLTEALPQLVSVVKHSPLMEDEILQAAASLAQVSAHPFSKALVRAARERHLTLEHPSGVETFTGKGLSGTLSAHGPVLLGSAGMMNLRHADTSGFELAEESGTPVFFAAGTKVQAVFLFDEVLRPGVREACTRLKNDGIQIYILTGDQTAAAEKWAACLGAEVRAGMTPAGKYEWAREWERKNGPALAVGEGLNDAPMLAGAGISLAMGGALDKTRDSADFVLPDNDLTKMSWLIETSRRAMNRIKGNLFWAFFYNLLAVPLAAAGVLNPVLAALLMIFSSVLTVVRSLSV